MNRKIKFRVWCKTTKHFTDIPFYSCSGGQLLWHHTGNEITISNIDEGDYEIQQFIGLKDSKGVEIYEGDLINFSVNNTVELGDKDIMDYKNQDVHYSGEFAGFMFGEDGFTPLDRIIMTSIEVVGNIFEK
tara:strand:+ start:141 stop:533 length:393 start_codon:yes stop_codon:yes gene_type:complete